MGYESKIYIAEKGCFNNKNGKTYASIIAMFDMGKFYPLSDVLRYKPETNCYFYADDHNTEVLEDRYGRPLTETTIADVIRILEKIVADEYDYRRIFPLFSTLQTIEKQQKDGLWGEIVVMHYGY